MAVRGRVRNGVVVLPEGTRFAEGQEVIVLPQRSEGDEVPGHSILDIPTIRLGAELIPTEDLDLLGEMLEGRR